MPIGIFLFSLKSDFQKSEGNGGKRRKPEKISGFSVGIFFVKTHWRRIPEFRALREYSHTLRLASELADLRVANANRILLRPKGAQSPIRWEGGASNERSNPVGLLRSLARVDKKDANR